MGPMGLFMWNSVGGRGGVPAKLKRGVGSPVRGQR